MEFLLCNSDFCYCFECESSSNVCLVGYASGPQHKLGYLVGKLYSRVGTEDWVPGSATKSEFDALVNNLLEQATLWLPKENHAKILKELAAIPLENLSASDLEEAANGAKQKRAARLTEATDAVGEVLNDLGINVGMIEKAKNRLRNQATFAGLIK